MTVDVGPGSSSKVERARMAASGPARRVLIVEDDLLIALDAELTLQDAGHDVIGTATTEDDAVETALREEPDILLLDLRLARGGCGRRVAERVRDALGVSIIFASGNLTPQMRERLARLDPVAMISKPYLEAQLLGAVAKAA